MWSEPSWPRPSDPGQGAAGRCPHRRRGAGRHRSDQLAAPPARHQPPGRQRRRRCHDPAGDATTPNVRPVGGGRSSCRLAADRGRSHGTSGSAVHDRSAATCRSRRSTAAVPDDRSRRGTGRGPRRARHRERGDVTRRLRDACCHIRRPRGPPGRGGGQPRRRRGAAIPARGLRPGPDGQCCTDDAGNIRPTPRPTAP